MMKSSIVRRACCTKCGAGSLQSNLPNLEFTHLSNNTPWEKITLYGGEFGQFIEWRYYEGLTWDSLDDELNKKMQHFTAKLNEFYREHRALWGIRG